jgi:ribosome biogenesis protein ERB1
MHWYDDLPHLGYNINGKRVLRPAKGDELDRFLQTVEDPNSWYTMLFFQSCHTNMLQDNCF